MVFIAGPRQIGKTTLAKRFVTTKDCYLNWDISNHREKILKHELPNSEILIFDEIHKYKSWRNYLKGIYDDIGEKTRILVTGSARLDYYKFSGDSLQGRYFFYRMHPLSVRELEIHDSSEVLQLLKLSGFPEPFFSGSEKTARRWSREYKNLLINDDIRTLERVSDIGNIELLAMRLPELVGSPLSIQKLSQVIQISHKTIANWLNILERLYFIYRIPPFGSAKIRSVKKEQKHYHFDWSLVKDQPAAFENLTAGHLLKWVHFQQDTEGHDYELYYFRDIDGREVDFVLTLDGQPIHLVEVKWNDTEISKSLKYLKTKYPAATAWQISAIGQKEYVSREGIIVSPCVTFFNQFI